MKNLYRLLAIQVGLAVFFLTTLCLLAIRLSAQGLDDPVITGFTQPCREKMRPCWNGIALGATPMEQARRRLIALGYRLGSFNDSLRYTVFYASDLEPGCVKLGYERNGDVVSYMQLYCLNRMSIGRFAGGAGIPQAVLYRGAATSGDTEYLTYWPNDPLEGVLLGVGAGWHSAHIPVASINLISQGAFRRNRETLSRWHGFMPMWHYCHLEPAYPRCTQK